VDWVSPARGRGRVRVRSTRLVLVHPTGAIAAIRYEVEPLERRTRINRPGPSWSPTRTAARGSSGTRRAVCPCLRSPLAVRGGTVGAGNAVGVLLVHRTRARARACGMGPPRWTRRVDRGARGGRSRSESMPDWAPDDGRDPCLGPGHTVGESSKNSLGYGLVQPCGPLPAPARPGGSRPGRRPAFRPAGTSWCGSSGEFPGRTSGMAARMSSWTAIPRFRQAVPVQASST